MPSFPLKLSSRMRDELRDRFDELISTGLESSSPEKFTVDDATRTLEAMEEGALEVPNRPLEAIILRFGRPAYLVQDDTFDTTSTPSSSEEVDAVVNAARGFLEGAIPSVGRVDLRNHRAGWVGTGWIVAPGIVVTNRHVAEAFAVEVDSGFAFVENFEGRAAKASLDTVREHGSGRESVFRVQDILWLEPSLGGHHDVAFLRIRPEGEDDQPPPSPLQLIEDAAFEALEPSRWVSIIGYPAFSIYNNSQDQQRIFDGIFDVKRLQPGQLSAQMTNDELNHDATTLGGNSGSVVLDLEAENVIGLHFGGLEGQTNSAVPAPVIRRLLQEKLSIEV
ncbi:MAG: serine protease [Myxococcota bacterium]